MAEKYFVTPNELLRDSQDLAKQIWDSDFRPDILIALWRGGASIGVAVHDYLAYRDWLDKGCPDKGKFGPDHFSVKTSRYDGIGKAREKVCVEGLNYLVGKANPFSRLLIVDDTHDAGTTIDSVINDIHGLLGSNTPRDIRVGVIHDKPENNVTGRTPDFRLYETNHWLVYPHEVKGLTPEEIRIKNEIIYGGRQNQVSLQRRAA
jgi:uncharacterized protein